jgi:hypothetical protein
MDRPQRVMVGVTVATDLAFIAAVALYCRKRIRDSDGRLAVGLRAYERRGGDPDVPLLALIAQTQAEEGNSLAGRIDVWLAVSQRRRMLKRLGLQA